MEIICIQKNTKNNWKILGTFSKHKPVFTLWQNILLSLTETCVFFRKKQQIFNPVILFKILLTKWYSLKMFLHFFSNCKSLPICFRNCHNIDSTLKSPKTLAYLQLPYVLLQAVFNPIRCNYDTFFGSTPAHLFQHMHNCTLSAPITPILFTAANSG